MGSIGNSPLSQLGLGEMLPEGGTRQQAMGEAGSATSIGDNVNLLNPAQLYYNRQLNLEASIRSGARWARNDGASLRSGRITPLAFNMVLPIARPLTIALGLRQHAAVDYSTTIAGLTANDADSSRYSNYYSGAGALSQANVGLGLKLAEGLTIGAQATYWLGNLHRFSDVSVGQVALQRESSSRVSDVQFRLGTAYRFGLPKGRRGSIALSGDLPKHLGTSDEVVLRRFIGNTQTGQDTLQKESSGILIAPQTLRLGLAYERPQHFTVVADIVRELWKGTQPLGTTLPLLDGMRAGLGVEWIPNINGAQYLSLASYRAGVFARQLPYELNGHRMSDIGATLGLGFPILRKEARYTRPIVNLNMTMGRRSTFAGSGYSENYVNFTLGILLNDAQWFVRYKID